jgi:hypothetical protein
MTVRLIRKRSSENENQPGLLLTIIEIVVSDKVKKVKYYRGIDQCI